MFKVWFITGSSRGLGRQLAEAVLAELREKYKSTVEALAEYILARAGKGNGDPAKAAQVILLIAGMSEPPLRLLLGSDAVNLRDSDSFMS
jgi:hypothetical protein